MHTSKGAAERKGPGDPVANERPEKSNDAAAAAGVGAHTSARSGKAETIPPRGAEDLAWMIVCDSPMETTVRES